MRRLIVLVMLLVSSAPGLAAARGATAPPPALRAAVLYFDYDGHDDQLIHLRKGLTAMLISDLSGVSNVQLVERSDLQKVIDELELGKKRMFDHKTTARIGKLLGANVLVTGRYFTFGGKLMVTAKVIDVETGEVKGVRAARPVEQFFDLESELRDQLAAQLSARAAKASPGKPAAKKPVKRRVKPSGPRRATRSAIQYGRALDAIDHGDKTKARQLLNGIVKAEPTFVLAQQDLRALVR